MKRTYFTSEHVSPGHPDKIMDALAEAVVDFHLEYSTKIPRVAVDGLVKNNKVMLVGEITSSLSPNYPELVKGVIRSIGYTPERSPSFNYNNFDLETIFTVQSPDIAQGVDSPSNDVGAGDIGIMFGGAVEEAPDLTCWSHYLSRLISFHVFNSKFSWIRPDQKTQVTIEYNERGQALRVSEIVLCVSHEPASQERINFFKEELTSFVYNLLGKFAREEDWDLDVYGYTIHINPTGKFEEFGPVADSGLVGRKIVCDQYGGFFPVGGGNLNGKDATKVDRSAVYMARQVAKSVVAKGMASKCQIQVSYSIGKADPVSINVETFGTENIEKQQIEDFVNSISFKPRDIISKFKLSSSVDAGRNFFYYDLGKYGHIGKRFGDERQLPWEELIK